MKLTDDWFTSLSHTDEGQLVFVTVRKGLGEFIASRKLRVRVDLSLSYETEAEGSPSYARSWSGTSSPSSPATIRVVA